MPPPRDPLYWLSLAYMAGVIAGVTALSLLGP